MSDPVTNVEMQDVLSSIRRLVTENARSAPRKEFPVDKADDEPQEAREAIETTNVPEEEGRLVLTPSLRVMPPPDTESVEEDTPDEMVIDAEILRFGEDDYAPAEVSDEGVEKSERIHDGIDRSFVNPDSTTALDAAEENAESQGEEDDIANLDMPWLKPAEAATETDVSEPPAPREIQARFDAVENVVEDDYEPDAPGDSAYAGTETRRVEWQVSDPEVTDDVDMADEYAAMTEHLEEGARDYIGRAVQKEIGSDIGILPDDAQIMDEDALRDLVADIVRQELQGALGERITRNVRKLVRREIHRALAAAELE